VWLWPRSLLRFETFELDDDFDGLLVIAVRGPPYAELFAEVLILQVNDEPAEVQSHAKHSCPDEHVSPDPRRFLSLPGDRGGGRRSAILARFRLRKKQGDLCLTDSMTGTRQRRIISRWCFLMKPPDPAVGRRAISKCIFSAATYSAMASSSAPWSMWQTVE